jgi:hypothetical protein
MPLPLFPRHPHPRLLHILGPHLHEEVECCLEQKLTTSVAIQRDEEKSSGSSGRPSHDSGGQIPPDDPPRGELLNAQRQPTTQPDGMSSSKPSRLVMRDGGPENSDDFSGSLRRQNSDSPTEANLALVEVFKTVFRGLCDADGRVKHYDLVTKLINSQKFGRGGLLAMINSMLEAGMNEGLPGGYYSEIRKGRDECL